MKKVRRSWLIRALIAVAGVFSLRLIATALHMTTLDRLYKPRDFRKTSHIKVGPEITEKLPKYCTTVYGLKMDPINLVFVGTEAHLRRMFKHAGWHEAHPSTPAHLAFGLLSTLFRRSYRKGPFMPLFVNVGLQDMAFQKKDDGHKHSQRHHVRIWRTRHTLPNGLRLWVGAATHELGVKVVWLPPYIVHKMDPDLDYERDFIVNELIDGGALVAGSYQVIDPISRKQPKRNINNDYYFTDGKATIVELV